MALLSIAMGIDVVSNALGFVSKKSVAPNVLMISEFVILVLYYVFLVFADLAGVIYITAVPSLLLGVLFHLWKRNSPHSLG